MSESGRGRTGGRGNGRGRGSTSNREKGIVPFPAAPAAPVNVVNRFQSLGQIPTPKTYNSALASQSRVTDPFDPHGPSNVVSPNNPGGTPFDICLP